MNVNLKRYPAYQESGVPWLGNVPAHWQQLPGRACFIEDKTPNVGMQETTVLSLSYGQIVVKPPEKLHGLVPASFETYQIIEPYDIVIRPTDLQNDWVSLRTGLAKTRGIITSAYMRLRPKNSLAPEYGHLLLHVYDLKKVLYGLGSGLRQNLSWRDFKYLPCLVPPPDEQAAITRFLDHIDRRTRRYIRAKRKLIALLNEQKRASIQRAVTRGLNPRVRLKPTGVEWLGNVPEHWDIQRIKSCLTSVVAGVWGDDPMPDRSEDHIVCVRVADFDMECLAVSDKHLTVRSVPSSARMRRLLAPGDLLLEKSGGGESEPVGRVVAFNLDCPALSSNFISRVRPNEQLVQSRFLLYVLTLLQSTRRNVLSIKQTTGIQNLDQGDYFNNVTPIPPVDEQNYIVDGLERPLASLRLTQMCTIREIELISEYHTRLIADVVTGKLDVRQAAANLHEEVEESDEWDQVGVEEIDENKKNTDDSPFGEDET